jgi:hypothetical protein
MIILRKNRYQRYIVAVFLISVASLVARTILDISIFLSTDRIIGAPDSTQLMLVQKAALALKVSPNKKRILIVSGSNGLLGISAATIAQTTGIETLNLSSHAGLGGEYILRWASNLIREGDVILLPLEYQFYAATGISDDFVNFDALGRFAISYDHSVLQEISTTSQLKFALLNSISGKDWKEYISYFGGHLSKTAIQAKLRQRGEQGHCYTAFTLNKYGDETCNIGKDSLPIDPAVLTTAISPSMSEIDPSGYIKKFVQIAAQKGAKVIPLYPVSTYTDDYQNPAFQESVQNIKKFWQAQGLEFQDSLSEALLPPSLMYNTNYHPKDAGRSKRTKSIIELLKKQSIGIEK